MRMEGAYPGSTYDPKQCPFWPAEFRKQGYHTAHIGKWHTGTDAGFGRDWDYKADRNRPRVARVTPWRCASVPKQTARTDRISESNESVQSRKSQATFGVIV